jgi:hypothetical protein
MKITYKTIKQSLSNKPESIITDLTLSTPNNYKTIICHDTDTIDYNRLPKRFNVIHIQAEDGNYRGFLNCYKRS